MAKLETIIVTRKATGQVCGINKEDFDSLLHDKYEPKPEPKAPAPKAPEKAPDKKAPARKPANRRR